MMDELARTQLDLALNASAAINERTALGAEKYDPTEWRRETATRHIRRAIKHALTALEIADGEREPDDESHIDAAVCRMAMGAWVLKQDERNGE